MKFSRDDIVAQLSRTIGDEKARDVVDRALTNTELLPPLELEEALEVLDAVAENEVGIVGVTARFAKSRLFLTAAQES